MWGLAWCALAMTIIFLMGYFYHLKKSKEAKDQFFNNKVQPSAFTLKFTMTEELWKPVVNTARDGESLANWCRDRLIRSIEKVLEH